MTAWWGTFEVPLGQQRQWRIGPASVWVERLAQEWKLAWERTGDANDVVEAAVASETDLQDRENIARFGVDSDDTELIITPALADRPVVTRPTEPFSVPASQTVTVFVGSPLWIQVSLAGSAAPLLDQALIRPSDTWFGPNTRVGELCYASRTACRLRLADLPQRPHRAATAITIRNRASKPLALDRINLPVMYLGLHRDASGVLWTESVELVHLDDEALAPLTIADAPPSFANCTDRVARPRIAAAGNKLVRAFSSLFS